MLAFDAPSFTHLRVHSHFSLLASTVSIPDLVRRAAADGLRAVALTDRDALYGAVAFTRACRQASLQPILGLSVPLAPPPDVLPDALSVPGRLTLLAQGPEGYRSLCRLSAALQAHPERATRLSHGLSWSELESHRSGLLCLEPGTEGWMSRYLRAGRQRAASRYSGRLGALFPDAAYVGLELHRPADAAVAAEMVQMGERFGMPAVAAQPVFSLEPAPAATLRLLAAIDYNAPVAQVPAAVLPARGDPEATLHWESPAENAARFAGFAGARQRVAEVIERCGPALPVRQTVWPALGLPDGQSAAAALDQQAAAGLDRLPRLAAAAPVYAARLRHELAAINGRGFAPLFLLVTDLVRFARQQDIPVSTRGSVANCLVAYALQITTVDPVAHGLLFERFLNPSRANLPDIDLDFCSRRRDEVLSYVRRRYGADRVALVGSTSTLQPKSAVREVGKAHGLLETRLRVLAGLVPHHWHPDPRRRQQVDLAALSSELENATEQAVLAQALRLVGQPHHLSLHPGGVVITPGPLTDWVPVQWAAKGFLCTQYDHRDLEAIGLPKIDLLGIRALTVLADAAELVRAHHDPGFHLADVPVTDEATGELLARGSTVGVFQCESTGAQRTLRQLQARTVQDLAVANAFFKPGPATGGMARAFVRRYRGEEPVSFLHPSLSDILGATQGVLLFQEQVLRIAVEIAGLSWAQADHLRRGMSKFRPREMAALRIAFVTGCQRRELADSRLTLAQAETLWEQIMAFAGYGFNQGHATAYADVSYRSAYLKAHYPAEFLAARLADRGGFHHPVIYLAEARRLGLHTRPPHVNVSRRHVTLTQATPEAPPTLWLGLGQVRALRRSAAATIDQMRPFVDARDLLRRVPLQAKEAIHLIQCGALDGLGESRAAMLATAAEINRAGSAGQLAFSFARPAAPAPETAAQRLAWEQAILGWPMSVHPLDLVDVSDALPLRRLAASGGQEVTVAGVRLPGWTGGSGWFLGDRDTYCLVRGRSRPEAWRPVRLRGRLRRDPWGGAYFEAAAELSL